MARAKKEVKDATISETKEKKIAEKKIEENIDKEEKKENVEKAEKKENVEKAEKKENVEKAEKKEKKEKKKKEGLIKGIRKEMKQVVWPSAGTILKSTIAVLVMCIFLVLFFEALMLFMAWLKVFLKGLFV